MLFSEPASVRASSVVLLLTVRLAWNRRVTLQHEFNILPSVDQPRCSVAILGRDDRLGPLSGISFCPTQPTIFVKGGELLMFRMEGVSDCGSRPVSREGFARCLLERL